MAGADSNAHPDCFHQADLDEAVGRLVRLIREERPQVIITYSDDQSGYPHPDHLKVHDISLPAFERAGDPRWYPEAGLPWQPLKLYYSVWTRRRLLAVHQAMLALRSRHPRFDMWLRGEACAPDPSAETLRALAFMTAPLPVPGPPVPSGFTLRAFVPGRDEASWLALNNLAFAGHPEQGSWSEADLLACEAEAWFDPSTFLLLERDGRLAAASWMRAHERPHGLDGELRVLSVHPDFRGLRLGEVAVSQGFAALARLGVSRATLYVDEANGSAMALYQRLGFVVARRDRLVRFGG